MTVFLFIVAIIYAIYLTNKVSRLEKKVEELGSGKVIPSVTSSTSTVPAQSNIPATATAVNQPLVLNNVQTTTVSTQNSALMTWFTTDWLLKLGALLLILGIAWFVSYAFAENWIGPVGRVTLGLIVGSLILIFGEWRGSKSEVQGTIFMAVGAVTILLTTYAARTVYDFFTPLSAMGVMLAAVVSMSISSVVRKTPNRAMLSLVLAAIVPFLTASNDTSVIALLSYGFMIITGTIWIVSITGWRQLTVLAMVIYWIYSLLSLAGPEADDIFLLRIFVFAFGLLFYATSLIAHIRVEKSSVKEYFVSLANALLFAIWIYNVVPDYLLSIVTSAVALLFFVGAYIVAKFSKQSGVVIEYVGVALALLAAAATFELKGPALTITYSLIVCVGMYLTLQLKQKLQRAQATGFLLIPVFLHSLLLSESNSRARYGAPVNYDHLIAWWVLAIELLGLGFLFYRTAKSQENKDAITLSAVYLIGGVFLSLFTLWHTLEMFITKPDTAHAWALVLSTVIGLGLYIISRIESYKKSMYTGASVLGFVVIRLLLVEVWTMELFQRVIIFTLIGILLMSTAFIKPKQKEISA